MRYTVNYSGAFFTGDNDGWNCYETNSWERARELFYALYYAGFVTTDLTYGDFFLSAPNLHPKRTLITGVVCGVRVETVEEPLMREIRYLDKLVDELAKGKPMGKILRG